MKHHVPVGSLVKTIPNNTDDYDGVPMGSCGIVSAHTVDDGTLTYRVKFLCGETEEHLNRFEFQVIKAEEA